MSWFSSKRSEWDLTTIDRPWRDGKSIYAHIRGHIPAHGTGLREGAERLPDEVDDGAIKWAAGAMDGAFGHHGGGANEKARAKMLHRALKVVLDDASSEKVKKLYEHLLGDGVLDFIDPLLALIVRKQDLDPERLAALATWIAENAPDRGPVKFAIALMGILPGADHDDLLLTLGRHEEFTLYSAVALSNGAGAEASLFALAQHVDGWGRIQIVERLADTTDPQIQSWMLREGYRNSIMYEYLAYTCAVAGDLRGALEAPQPDAALLTGAGEIIQALIAGGPAEDMDDYADGAAVVDRYLFHLGAAPKQLDQLISVHTIQGFLDEEDADWKARAARGWPLEQRAALRERVARILALPHWHAAVTAGLASADATTFWTAESAAKAIGLDTWDYHFQRLEAGTDSGWFHVMRTDDSTRIDRVVALAEQLLPLDTIAAGPAEALGLGPEWASHGHLDFVLQDLRRFPGKGWPLIRAGIRSPVVRNRHMALRALSPWGIDGWPQDAKPLLQRSLADEPTEDVRQEIEALLAGQPLVVP